MGITRDEFKRTFEAVLNNPRFPSEDHYFKSREDRLEEELREICIETHEGYIFRGEGSLTYITFSSQNPIKREVYERRVSLQTSGQRVHPDELLRLLEKSGYHFEPKNNRSLE